MTSQSGQHDTQHQSNNAPRPDDAGGAAQLADLSGLVSQPVRWLWPGRVPMGKVTLLSGDPGLGKSFLTLDLAAKVSTAVLPTRGCEGGDGGPGMALILSAEDDPADTIKPRLEAMHAALRNIRSFTGVKYPGGGESHLVSLDRDVYAIGRAIKALDGPPVRLIIIDPITAYMGKVDGNANTEVRGLLAQLSRLAEWSGAAIVCVSHLNKNDGQRKAVYRSMGSLAFTAAARVVLMVAKHPGEPDKRIVTTVKNNLTKEHPAIAYRIDRGRIDWLDEDVSHLTADTLQDADAARGALAIDEACQWLDEMLQDGPIPVGELEDLAKCDGQSWRTVQRAKKQLGVIAQRIAQDNTGTTKWQWAHKPR